MSQEDLQRFYQLVLSDSELRQVLQAAPDKDSFINRVIQAGQEKGYSFTAGEIESFMAELQPSDQLSDLDLESVAGGKCSPLDPRTSSQV